MKLLEYLLQAEQEFLLVVKLLESFLPVEQEFLLAVLAAILLVRFLLVALAFLQVL